MDTWTRDREAVTAGRWSSLNGADTFSDEFIRLQSGKYVFRGDIERANDLSSVPLFNHPGDRPAMAGLFDKIPTGADLMVFFVTGFFIASGWITAEMLYRAVGNYVAKKA